ncbi:MAG: hypothetical protein R2719_07755 [Micropruina sp.]
MAALGTWGRHHLPVSPELSIRAELLERGGPSCGRRSWTRLRELHLGLDRGPAARSVLAELTAAYLAEVARVTADGSPAEPG